MSRPKPFEQTLNSLLRQEVLGDGFKIITTRDLEAKFIAYLVEPGGEILIWQLPPSDINLLELLSDYGAVHVLALNQPNFVGV